MTARILIAGGYGLVGGWIARHVRAAGHDVELILAGRHPEVGRALAAELGARTARLDVLDAEAGLTEVGPVDLVVAALIDPGDSLLTASLKAGAAHIGIVGMAESVASIVAAAARHARRPALIAGHWQAGALVAAAQVATRAFSRVNRVELTALYDYADPIGPMTEGDAASFGGQATLRENDVWVRREARSDPRNVARRGGPAFDALPTGVLDVFSLAAVTGAADVRFDLGVGASLGTLSGGPASHDLYVDLEGVLSDGSAGRRRWRMSDPKGQAHLTGLGVLVGIERILGLDGAPAPKGGGVAFPENLLNAEQTVMRLQALGVRFEAEALA